MITLCTRFAYIFFKGSSSAGSSYFHLKYFKIDILMSSHFSQVCHSDHSSLAMRRDLLCITNSVSLNVRNYKNQIPQQKYLQINIQFANFAKIWTSQR